MSINRLTISASVLLAMTGAAAQSSNNKHISWWPAYYLRYSINKKWVVNTDVQARNFAKQPTLGLLALRTGAHYYFNKQWSTAVGGAWFHQRQESGAGKKIVSDEVRLWEELKHELKVKKWQLINQFRTEQRHWTSQQGLAFRFRYRLAGDLSIGEKWKALAGNEIMWQTSNNRKNWDQYRAWVGGEYAFNTKKQVQLVLMKWWQYNNGTQQPVVRINFVQSINAVL